MGIDYKGNYGIGFEVDATDDIDEFYLEDGLVDYIYENISDEYDVFEIGSLYSGEIDGTYVVIREPFKNGLDLTSEKEKLITEIKRMNLDIIGDFGTHGGVLVS